MGRRLLILLIILFLIAVVMFAPNPLGHIATELWGINTVKDQWDASGFWGFGLAHLLPLIPLYAGIRWVITDEFTIP